jgi:hypothetical protein
MRESEERSPRGEMRNGDEPLFFIGTRARRPHRRFSRFREAHRGLLLGQRRPCYERISAEIGRGAYEVPHVPSMGSHAVRESPRTQDDLSSSPQKRSTPPHCAQCRKAMLISLCEPGFDNIAQVTYQCAECGLLDRTQIQ